MIQLNIFFKNSPMTLPLFFKAYKKAEEVRKQIQKSITNYVTDSNKEAVGAYVLVLEDDYGTYVDLAIPTVGTVGLTDLDKEMDRQGEFAVMQTLSQQKAQRNLNASMSNKIVSPIGIIPGQPANR